MRFDIYGRERRGRDEDLEKNAERHGDAWPVHVGLMRGHSALGRHAQALEHARKAVGQAPDDLNRMALEAAIVSLEAGEDHWRTLAEVAGTNGGCRTELVGAAGCPKLWLPGVGVTMNVLFPAALAGALFLVFRRAFKPEG